MVLLAGYLYKRGAGAAIGGKLSNTKYKRRFFALEGTNLKYYKDEVGSQEEEVDTGPSAANTSKKNKEKKRFQIFSKSKKNGSDAGSNGMEPLGSVDLRLCEFRKGDSTNHPTAVDTFVFELMTPQRVWNFQAEDAHTLQRWEEELTRAIEIAAACGKTQLPGLLKEGMLSKCGHKVKSWKDRWFILEGGRLTYYTKQYGQKKGEINLLHSKVTIVDEQLKNKSYFQFKLVHTVPDEVLPDSKREASQGQGSKNLGSSSKSGIRAKAKDTTSREGKVEELLLRAASKQEAEDWMLRLDCAWTDADGTSATMLAAKAGNLARLTRLLAAMVPHNAGIDHQNSRGWSALKLAAHLGPQPQHVGPPACSCA